MGPETEAFERAFADYLGVGHAVGVNSGADALTLALTAAGIVAGDEVIVPSLTAVPTAGAICQAGAVPRFVEVDRETRLIDPSAVEAAIGPRTAAIVPVHLHGFPADMPAIAAIAVRHKLLLVEDCAQAHGATIDGRKVGSFGHAAAFSFYPTKNLGAAGDAGLVATDDADLALRVRRLRSHGFDEQGLAVELSGSRRLDEIQAAILSTLLPYLDDAIAERRVLAAQYRTALRGLPLGMPPADPGSVYHQFAIVVDGRDDVRNRLEEDGVRTLIHYPVPAHRHPIFAKYGASLPVTDDLSARLLSLPIQPEVVNGRIGDIAAALARSLKS